MHRREFIRTLALGSVLSAIACSGTDGGVSTTQVGGATNAGASSNPTGGSLAVSGLGGGGSPGTGGIGAGGLRSSGGTASSAPATGGALTTGGNKATGGTLATGGALATGGVKASGGASVVTGGAKATGGASPTGGSKAVGGSAPTGGTTATGGANGGVACSGLLLPPAPATSGVAQPSASVSAPNLKVLPWAGFKSAISYTFDDSQPSQTEHMAELQAAGVPLTFFINASANWQANYDANWKAVAAAGHELGNHTWSHCYSTLSGCTAVGDQNAEIDNNTNYITTHLGQTGVYSFAAPFGDTTWNTWVKPRFIMDRGVIGGMVPATGPADWYNLPVYGVSAGDTATNFNAAIDSAHNANSWVIFLYHSILPTTQNWTAGVQITDITASVAHAKSFGDVWFDAMGWIAAYAKGKQIIEALGTNLAQWTWTLPTNFPPHRVLRVTIAGGKLSQNGVQLAWDSHGYYQVCLDAGNLSWSQ